MRNIALYIVLSSLISLCTLNCTMGTGSEVEAKFQLTGKAVYQDGKPVEGAQVRIRSSHYLAFNNKEHFYSYDTITDNAGYYHFDTIGVDSYTIEINKSGRFGSLADLSVTQQASFPIHIPTATVVPTGAISGRINLPITDDTTRPLIAIYGVEHMEKALITQNFCFNGVPAGIYTLILTPRQGSNLRIELPDVAVFSDSVTDAGILNLPLILFYKGCNSWQCDSLAVRALLDANGLQQVTVRSVVTLDPQTSRVTALNLAAKELTVLTKEIGSLSRLKTLNVVNNHIEKIPREIGYLNQLKELYADSNRMVFLPYEIYYADSLETVSLTNNELRELPEDIYRLNHLENLYLHHNKLKSLPPSIYDITMIKFTCKFNHLCSVPLAARAWIQQYDAEWAATQICDR